MSRPGRPDTIDTPVHSLVWGAFSWHCVPWWIMAQAAAVTTAAGEVSFAAVGGPPFLQRGEERRFATVVGALAPASHGGYGHAVRRS